MGGCRAGDFSGKGSSRVLAGSRVSLGPQGGRVKGKVLVPETLAKSSGMRKKPSPEALGRRSRLRPSFQVWRPQEGPVLPRQAGSRKRCGLDTPPSRSCGGGGAWCGGPPGRRGPGATLRPPREVGPRQAQRRRVPPPLPAPGGPCACVRTRPASSRCTRGAGAGERRGGGDPQQNLRRAALGSTRMEGARGRGAQPRPGSVFRRRGAAPHGAGRSRYRARAAGWAEGRAPRLGGGLRLPRLLPTAPAAARAGAGTATSRPLRGIQHRGHSPISPSGRCDPCAIETGQGLFSLSGQRLVPSPRAPPAAHIWKESESGWGGEGVGRRRATGNVGAGETERGLDPLD